MKRFIGKGPRGRYATAISLLSVLPAIQPIAAAAQTISADVPARGETVPAFATVDEIAARFVASEDVPALSIAIAKDGKLVYARAFGHADRDRRLPADPDSLFRIASISKIVTATAILQLADRGRLKLDDRAIDLLGIMLPDAADQRWRSITIRHLLQHTAGFDRQKSGDPTFKTREIATELKVPSPATAAQIVTWGLTRPLDFSPGERMAYSNYGYVVLGAIIEKVSGRAYEEYVRENILRPAGIAGMRAGATRTAAPGEVRYYNRARRLSDNVFDQNNPPQKVPRPYGGWAIESMTAAGGWIASAPDLLRLLEVADGRMPSVLSPEMAAEVARNTVPTSPSGQRGYGLGRFVEIVEAGGEGRPPRINKFHTGGLEGTSTILARRWNGISYAILTNSDRPDNGPGLMAQIEPQLIMAITRVKDWPAGEALLKDR